MKRVVALMLALSLAVALPPMVAAQTSTPFWMYDFYHRSFYQVQASQKYVGSHCRVFGGTEVTAAQARQVGQAFDYIYNDVVGIIGQPPDVDGDPLITILIADIRDVYTHDPMAVSFIRAYFDPRNESPGAYSNGREMIYLDNGQQSPTEVDAKRALAHELGRMIIWGKDPDEEAWLVEGFGFLAERLAGYGHRSEVGAYLADPARSLTGWTGDARDVGASYLLMLYVYEQFGASTVAAIADDQANGLMSVAEAVGMAPDALFRRWALANFLDSSGIYRYASLDVVDSGEDNISKFRRSPATVIPRPGANAKQVMTGILCGGGVRYYRVAAGSPSTFLRIRDEKARVPEWEPTLAGGFGASWMRNYTLIQEGLLNYTHSSVPGGDTFLLCVSPFRERGATDYRYVLYGTYQIFLPIVARNASGG